MIDYTRKFKTECSKAKLDPQVRAMAELMLQGWTAQDSFVVLGFNKPHLTDDYNKQQMDKIITDSDFCKYIETRQRSMKRSASRQAEVEETEDSAPVKLLSKEEVLQEALQTAMLLPKNDPKRVDVLMRFADLAQMKKENLESEEKLIHYYLPLTCNNCSLYLNRNKK